MRIADANVRELAATLAELQTDVTRLKESGRATQLGKSTIEGEQLYIRNSAGIIVGGIGMAKPTDSDEVFVITPMNPNPPSPPPVASLEPFNGGIMVSHDGTSQPVDYEYHNVYGGLATNFGNATLFGRIYGNDTFPITPLDVGVPYNVWLTQVNTSGKESQPGPMATAEPTAAVASEVLDGAITELKLADDAVTAAKVATGAITEVKIDNNAITDAKIRAKAIKTVHVDDGAITADTIAAEAVDGTKITPNAIESPHITAGAITAGKVAAGAITAGNIQANAIQTGHISANSIEGSMIAAGQIFAENIAAGAILTEHLTADSVTAGNIRANSISAQHIVANSIQADKIAADSITADKIVSQSITTRHLTALAITADKIAANAINAGHIQAGSITAAKLEANMVLTNRIIVGTQNGNRLELHPIQGMQGFTDNGATRSLWFNATDGSLLATGKWQTRPSTDTTRPRIEIDTDGTQTMVAPGNFIAGKIENIGSQGLMFRSGKLGQNASYLFLNSGYCGIYWGAQGGTTPASFRVDGAGTQQWGRLCGIRYEERYAGDGTAPRLFILGTMSDGSDPGFSTLHFMKRSSLGNEPIITATGQACGLLFENGYVSATTGGGGTSYGSFRGTFVAPSSEQFKNDLEAPRFRSGRTSWDIIEGAPTHDFYYKDDTPPPTVAQDDDGTPILRRVRNKRVRRALWNTLPDNHPDKWVEEPTPLDHVTWRPKKHRFPIAEDLAAIDPELVVDDAVDIRDMLGILWDAQDRMIKRQRFLEKLLSDNGIAMPEWPGKGDVIEGIGKKVKGRTRRRIDSVTGQAHTV